MQSSRAPGSGAAGRAARMLRALALAACAACSGPARNADLSAAEQAERRGDVDAALAAYRDAQTSCPGKRPSRQQRALCADAYLHHAELLERAGRMAEAAQAYESTAVTLAGDPTAASTATYRAGRLRLELGEDERAYELLWRVVTNFPDEAHAADALRLVLADGRRRNARQLYDVLAGLVTPLARTGIADSLLYAMADLAEHELGEPRVARAMLDKIVSNYPESGLRDDALWHGARLARAAGDARGAAARLRTLLATREVSRIVGSYFSVWLDDAQLALGRILRDDLGEFGKAAAAFARLPRDYPDSVLIDDARWEIAQTWALAGDPAKVCAALDRLGRAHPDSRYELSEAPALRRTYGCAEPGR